MLWVVASSSLLNFSASPNDSIARVARSIAVRPRSPLLIASRPLLKSSAEPLAAVARWRKVSRPEAAPLEAVPAPTRPEEALSAAAPTPRTSWAVALATGATVLRAAKRMSTRSAIRRLYLDPGQDDLDQLIREVQDLLEPVGRPQRSIDDRRRLDQVQRR